MALLQMTQIKAVFGISVQHTKSSDAWVNRALSLPFRILSHRYKIEHKIFENLTKVWENIVNNNVIKWYRLSPNPIQSCVCVCVCACACACVCFIQLDNNEHVKEISVSYQPGVFASCHLFPHPDVSARSLLPLII
uniref:Uncharacterized protein n=1 Tax=Molossus molossus TaxID=27622 RepID=A0A7J8GM09_MOLMO|nr:hypothetical protein HJG59_011524 [Molossus molossus]